MPTISTDKPSLLNTIDAAAYVGKSPRTLEKRRTKLQSPVPTRVGHAVFYDVQDLDSYLAESNDFVQGVVTSDKVVDSIVNAAPRFSPDQRTRICAVLSGGVSE
ncbi:phage transcriptional regulator, AlpA [Corynebacterium glutamicum MT]|uniref:DNA-binding protein n=1 Tax=Corynebacterium glutamicum TaxID=1718 RepID=A0AB36IDE2_CORGT|nr:hypothetical protein [Corynebacterium glutamicum]AGN18318.1 phage transcriptional regulator, AlpA [Corynebacterium glutamicum SCgG1]AGN21341.1 phage transcriptional regulator, AlpA [Corynebacterium glutamicum SCgG2]EGV41609.1 hypothetical protein CgS9114_02333 [Corynebacterium glutamicum S9114]EOA65580.1 phage transcriptional regulator, AlpA [Corynebacterium glutamicum MT]EPP41471.1 phage transcriptional regulator, AlpA [Corynebacterium glutamicum Z188]